MLPARSGPAPTRSWRTGRFTRWRGPTGDDGDGLVRELTRFLAEQRADAAAASRARERWLRQAAEEEATVAGVLLDLAERADVVVVAVGGERRHRGRVGAVGEDFVSLRTDQAEVLVRIDAVTSIRADGPPPEGATRACALDLTLAEALAALAGDRPQVLLVGRDGSRLSGEVRSVGRDVLALRPTDGGGTVHVPLAPLVEVVLTEAT